VLDPKKVADSVCKIETELCYLHGLLAAEECGVAALQSGEAPSQQLKPKMPLLEEVEKAVANLYPNSRLSPLERETITHAYIFISRHFGH